MVPVIVSLSLALAQPAGATAYQIQGLPGDAGLLVRPPGHPNAGYVTERSNTRWQLTGPAFNGPGVWRLAVPHGGPGKVTIWEARGWLGTGTGTFTRIQGRGPDTMKVDAVP